MPATSADVAREAGVSRATVSYVLNNTPSQKISPETRAAVLEAADRLGYQLHASARALRMGRTDAVLFPMPGIPVNHVFADVISACSVALVRHGLTLVTDVTTYPTPEDQATAWLRLQPAAVIDLTMRGDDPTLARIRRAGVPLLSAAIPGLPSDMSAFDVISDSARALQIEYLASRGHRELVHAIPAAVRSAHLSKGRQRHLETTAERVGAHLRVEEVDLTTASLTAAVERWRTRATPPDAICAYNDELAIALLGTLAEHGVDVPGRLAVIGVDDLPLASAVIPSLTTVIWTVEELGESLAAATTALLGDGEANVRFPIPALHVIRRGSA